MATHSTLINLVYPFHLVSTVTVPIAELIINKQLKDGLLKYQWMDLKIL